MRMLFAKFCLWCMVSHHTENGVMKVYFRWWVPYSWQLRHAHQWQARGKQAGGIPVRIKVVP